MTADTPQPEAPGIVERLRGAAAALPGCTADGNPDNVCTEAASHIEAQAAEIARLRAQMREAFRAGWYARWMPACEAEYAQGPKSEQADWEEYAAALAPQETRT